MHQAVGCDVFAGTNKGAMGRSDALVVVSAGADCVAIEDAVVF